MRRTLTISATVLVLGSIALFAISTSGCTEKKEAENSQTREAARPNTQSISYIDAKTLQKLIEKRKDLVIIDVLGPESYAKHHVKSAINIPLGKLDKYLNTLKKDSPIVTYCANLKCKASTRAAEILLKSGFQEVYDYEGGIADWVERGLPTGTAKLCKCGAAKGSPICCR